MSEQSADTKGHGRPLSLPQVQAMKQEGQPIVMLTAYDYSLARLAGEAGVDVLLVGDSLGNVIQGHDTTLPVTLDDMVYHSACVSRAGAPSLLIADMPFLEDADPVSAAHAARRLMGEGGASMVKIEGAGSKLEVISHLTDMGVPVCGHLGLTPQSVHQLGGFRVQGRDTDAARRILEDGQALADAGAAMLVIECVPDDLARQLTEALGIPVIGIGAGPHCDGQVLVMYDVLGLSAPPRPRFVRDFMPGAGSVAAALRAYVQAVRERQFPAAGESYG